MVGGDTYIHADLLLIDLVGKLPRMPWPLGDALRPRPDTLRTTCGCHAGNSR